MVQYTAEVLWHRGEQDFISNRYSRRHLLRFDGGIEVAGSASCGNEGGGKHCDDCKFKRAGDLCSRATVLSLQCEQGRCEGIGWPISGGVGAVRYQGQ